MTVEITSRSGVTLDHVDITAGPKYLEQFAHVAVTPPPRDASRVIYGELHKAGLEELRQVRWVVLETDGKISVIPAHSSGTLVRTESEKTTA